MAKNTGIMANKNMLKYTKGSKMIKYLIVAGIAMALVGCGEDSTSRVEYGVQGTASIPMDENTTFTMNTEDGEATAQLTTDGEGNNVLNVSCNDCSISVDYSDHTHVPTVVTQEDNNYTYIKETTDTESYIIYDANLTGV